MPTKRKAEIEPEDGANKITKVNRTIMDKPYDRSINNVTSLPKQGIVISPITPNIQATPASLNKAPKKGSFAAIMARAKEAQAAPASTTGSIMHKPKEKGRSRKELMLEREMAKKAAKKGVTLRSLQISKDRSIKEAARRPRQDQKNIGSLKSGYQGTMKLSEKSNPQRPKTPSTSSTYNGTAKAAYRGSATKSISRDVNSNQNKQTTGRGRSDHHESDEDGSGDQLDDESEDYSDMDAGFDDMENEEEQASRIARKEDAAAQAELDRLKREKDRKKSLLPRGKR